MINNDILRRLSTIFDLTDEKIRTIFALSQCEISEQQLANYFKEKDDAAYQEILDVELASFLNGLIIEKRGPSDGPARETEEQLTNNMIFNKIKIAMSLKAEEVISILELADLSLGKYELSAFFRNVSNKHYRDCSDDVLSTFLKGLKIKSQEAS
ncbi:MAG: DUF1456 family protein [Colwellia sp.]|uniref:DUF1456 family protein n=1 Tax=Colwellia sp. TaxID=56799 RepID=UPI001DB05E05|nr:DUF1456 family protein [Colwellia sp.]NQY49377.1 DUF1456 family protein [Colwellia sp.]NQZ26721.1 DUF1456 family protein [Colwellia sp.]